MEKETLEEASERIVKNKVGLHYFGNETSLENLTKKDYVIEGAKWQQEQDKKMYSEEDMMFAYEQGARLALISQSSLALHKGEFPTPKQWFEQFKKK